VDLKNNYLLKPQGAVSRWIDSIMLVMGGLSCFLAYYFIEYDVCLNGKCENLTITAFWVKTSYIYIVLGVSLLIVGVFIAKEKNISRIYSLGILVVCSGVALSYGLIFFAMLRELKSIS